VAQGPVATGVTAGGNFGFSWWKSAKANFLREGCDKAGNYCYTPLYALKRRREPSNWWRPFRAGERELEGDELSVTVFVAGLCLSAKLFSPSAGGLMYTSRGIHLMRMGRKIRSTW
jgi:hypothetical protein